jgi:hypothetical protein
MNSYLSVKAFRASLAKASASAGSLTTTKSAATSLAENAPTDQISPSFLPNTLLTKSPTITRGAPSSDFITNNLSDIFNTPFVLNLVQVDNAWDDANRLRNSDSLNNVPFLSNEDTGNLRSLSPSQARQTPSNVQEANTPSTLANSVPAGNESGNLSIFNTPSNHKSILIFSKGNICAVQP